LFVDYGQLHNVPSLAQLHTLQPAQYVVIETIVIPGSQGLLDALGILVRLSEQIKNVRVDADYPGGDLFPLEGTWEVPHASEPTSFEEGITGRIMMRQPDSVEPSEFERYRQELLRTSGQRERAYLEAARLVTVDEGLCVQLLHTGPYGDEPASFAIIAAYLEEHGLTRKSETEHREIYLVDARSAQPEAYQTILLVQVERTHRPGRKK
jgi:hypothetical protein